MTDVDRARRTELTEDLWATVRTAREPPDRAESRPWPGRRWLAVAAVVAVVGAGSLAALDLSSTASRTKARAAAHLQATAGRPRARAVHRKAGAHPKAKTHTRAPAAKRHESPKPTRKPRSRPQPHPAVPPTPIHRQPKTFAWVGVAGAAGYRVAFFRPSGAILFRDTETPRLTVPGTWRYEGKPQTLSPGRYRWYVWSLDGRGRRAPRPIVNSTLVIGR